MSTRDAPAGTTAGPRVDPGSQSLGEIVSTLGQDTSRLLRQEVALAKAELREDATAAGSALGMLAGALVGSQLALVLLSFAAVQALENVMTIGWAFTLVGVVWAVVAAVLASIGRARLRRMIPGPERTAESIREIPDVMRGR